MNVPFIVWYDLIFVDVLVSVKCRLTVLKVKVAL